MAFPVDEEKEKEKVQEQRLKDILEAGTSLLNPPPSTEELLNLLDKSNNMMIYMEQSNSEPTKRALLPLRNALKSEELFGTSDLDVKMSVISCISEMMRITAPEPPYDDDVLKEFFHLFVPVLACLSQNSTSNIYRKAALILEVAAEVRFCVLMVELKLEKLIIEMFQLFMKTIRSDHPDTVFKHMETIMTLVIEESDDDISLELLTSLLDSVRKDNQKFSPASWKLGNRVLKNVAAILKPCIQNAVHSSVISLGDYSEIVTSICDNGSTNGEDHICGLGEHVGTRADETNTGNKTSQQSQEMRENGSKLESRTNQDKVAKTSALNDSASNKISQTVMDITNSTVNNGTSPNRNGETVLIEKSTKPLRPCQLSEIIKSVQVHDNAETDALDPMKAFKEENNGKIVPKIGNCKPKSRMLPDEGYNHYLDSTCNESQNRNPHEEGIDCSHSSEKTAFRSTKDQVAEPSTSSPKVSEIKGSFIAKNSGVPDGSLRKRGRPKKNKILLNEDDSIDSSSVSNVDLLEARANDKTRESVDVSVKKDLNDTSYLGIKQDSKTCNESQNKNSHEEGIDCSHSSEKTAFLSTKDHMAEPPTSLPKVSEVGGSFIAKNSSLPDGSHRKRGRPKKNKIVLNEDDNINPSSVFNVDLLVAQVNEKTRESVDVFVKKDADYTSHVEAKQDSETCNVSWNRNPHEEGHRCSHSPQKTAFLSTKDQVVEPPTSSPKVSEIGGSFIAKSSSLPDGSHRKRGRPKKNKVVLIEDGNINSSSVSNIDLLEARANEKTWESVDVSVKKELDDTSHPEAKQATDSDTCSESRNRNPHEEGIDCSHSSEKTAFLSTKDQVSEPPTSSPKVSEIGGSFIAKNSSLPDGSHRKRGRPKKNKIVLGEDGNINSSSVSNVDLLEARVNEKTRESVDVFVKKDLDDTNSHEEGIDCSHSSEKTTNDQVAEPPTSSPKVSDIGVSFIAKNSSLPDGSQRKRGRPKKNKIVLSEDGNINSSSVSNVDLLEAQVNKKTWESEAKQDSPISDDFLMKDILTEKQKRDFAARKEKASVMADLDERLIGKQIKVWWPLDKRFYIGVVHSFDHQEMKHKVLYTDGEEELLNLNEEHWKLIGDDDSPDGEQEDDLPKPGDSSCEPPKRRKNRKTKSDGQAKTGSSSKRGRPPKKPKVEVDSETDNPLIDGKGNIEKSTDTGSKSSKHETIIVSSRVEDPQTCNVTGSIPTRPDTVIESKAEDPQKSSCTSSKPTTPDTIAVPKEKEADLPKPKTSSSHTSQEQKRNRKSGSGRQAKTGSSSKRGRPPKKPKVEVDDESADPVIDGKGNIEKSNDTSSKAATPETMIVSSRVDDPQTCIGTGSKPTTPDTVTVAKERKADPVPNASSHTPQKKKRNRKSGSVGQEKSGSFSKRGRPPKKPKVEVDLEPDNPAIDGKGNNEKSADTSSKPATPETFVVSSRVEDPQKSTGSGSKPATSETVIASQAQDATKPTGARPKPTTPDAVIVPKEQDADLPVPNASSHIPEKKKRKRKSGSVDQAKAGSSLKRGRPPTKPKDGQANAGSSAKRGRPPKKPMVEVDIKPEQTSSTQD